MPNSAILLQKLKERFHKEPTDVVGLDFGSTALKAARVKRIGSDFVLTAARLLPLPASTEAESQAGAGGGLDLPLELKAKHACLAVTAKSGAVKLLSIPGTFDAKAESRIVESMGIKDTSNENTPNVRVGYKTIGSPTRAESRVLAVSMPEEDAARATGLLAEALPVPYSLEMSSLATLTAFLHAAGSACEDRAVGVLEFGADTTFYAVFNKSVPALVRRFDFGSRALLGRLTESLGVNIETAESIVGGDAFDLSDCVRDFLAPLLRQLVVSRDFVERRENCSVSALFVSGGLGVSRDAMDELRSSLRCDVTPWSPLDGLRVQEHAVPPEWAGQTWRFSAAIGACLAVLEKS